MRAATGAYTPTKAAAAFMRRDRRAAKASNWWPCYRQRAGHGSRPGSPPTADRGGIGRLERAQRKAASGNPHRSFVLFPPMAASSIGVAKDGAEYFAGPEFMRSEGGETLDGKAILSHML